jgi:hypothetical protein
MIWLYTMHLRELKLKCRFFRNFQSIGILFNSSRSVAFSALLNSKFLLLAFLGFCGMILVHPKKCS